MKAGKLPIIILLFSHIYSFGQNNIGIGTNSPNASAALEVQSTNQGILPPRLSFEQRNSIQDPAAGLFLWCTDCGLNGELQVFNGVNWTNLTGSVATRAPIFDNSQVGNSIDGVGNYDFFGTTVDISGDGSIIAIGNNRGVGKVEVYEWINGTWTQLGSDLVGSTSAERSCFLSLSADGTRIAIGGPFNISTTHKGYVRVFDWNGAAWVQVGSDILGDSNNDRFGQQVSLSSDGTSLAVGAPFSGGQKGYVKVFRLNANVWTAIGTNLEGESAGDEFGNSIALSMDGNTITVGSPGHNSDTGIVKSYSWDGSSWTQLGSSIIGSLQSDEFGSSVDIIDDGTRIVIGAPEYDGGKGYVSVYDWTGIEWVQTGSSIVGINANDDIGHDVSISSDGSRFALSSQFLNSSKGETRIYDWNGMEWMQSGMSILGVSNFNLSGSSISLSGDGNRIIIGAKQVGNQTGHARVFE